MKILIIFGICVLTLTGCTTVESQKNASRTRSAAQEL